MNRLKLISATLAAVVITAGATAYGVAKLTSNGSYSSSYEQAFDNTAGNHFASYQQDKFPDLTYAAENAVKAVVNVENIQEVKSNYSRGRSQGGFNPFFEFFGIPEGFEQQQQQPQRAPQERRSGGSGVIISPDGYIVTNNHVVDKASKLKVTLNDNTTYTAKLIGTDPTTDIALIKIDAKDLPTIPFGDSEKLRLGEWVLAIGNPFDLRSTVTAGIVSAKARDLNVIPSDFRIESFIQTDAAVNPGNSGGALVDTKGNLVGINTVIKSPTGSYAGYSFAVPEAIVKRVVVDLKEFGMVQRALLGIQFQEITGDFLEAKGEELGIKEKEGIYVAEVTADGAAKAAGIKKGDIIIAVDSVKIGGANKLQAEISKYRPGDKVTLSVKRDGNVKPFVVTLRNRAGEAKLLKSDYVDVAASLGGEFSNLTPKELKELRISGGVRVRAIKPDGILAKARIRAGYVITHINDKSVANVADLSRITTKVTSIDGVLPDGRAASYSLVE